MSTAGWYSHGVIERNHKQGHSRRFSDPHFISFHKHSWNRSNRLQDWISKQRILKQETFKVSVVGNRKISRKTKKAATNRLGAAADASAATSPPDYVTRDELKAQENLFRELLVVQEQNFEAFVSMFMDSTNKRVDEFMVKTTSDLTSLRDSLEFSQAELTKISHETRIAISRLAATQDFDIKVSNLHAMYTDLEKQVESIDYYSRQNSLVIRGLSGSNDEDWSETEHRVRSMIRNKLHLNADAIEIKRAHRIGKTDEDGQTPCPIAVKFLRYKDKEDILPSSKKLKGTGIYINQSYSEKLNNKRAELWQEVKEHRRNGCIAYISFDRIVVKNRTDPRGVNKSRDVPSASKIASPELSQFSGNADALPPTEPNRSSPQAQQQNDNWIISDNYLEFNS